jgi:hypothetical protein
MSSYSKTQRFESSRAELKEEIYRHNVTGLWLAITVSWLIFDLENKEFQISQRRLKSQYAFNRAGEYCKASTAIYSSWCIYTEIYELALPQIEFLVRT